MKSLFYLSLALCVTLVSASELFARPIVQPRLLRYVVLAATPQRPLGRAARAVAAIASTLVARR